MSQLVIREASSGDEEAVRERLALVEGIPLLATTDAVGELAARLVGRGVVPRKAAEDGLHAAAVHGLDFLLTWNCKHIANAMMRSAIERVCREADK